MIPWYSTDGMNVFDSRHFRINKALFTFIGQWPFQSAKTHFISSMVIFVLAGTNIIAKLIATISLGSDFDSIIDDMPPLICDIMATIKLVNNALQMKKLKIILTRVQVDYASIASDDEYKIIRDYANGGRKFTIMYMGLLFVTLLCSTIPPMQEIIASNRNGSGERVYVHHTEYFVDPANYYYLIIFHSYVTIILVVYMIVSMDTLLVVVVQHACGLFTILGHYLCQLSDNNEKLIDLHPSKKNDESFMNISLCVHRHQKAIEFANLLDSYYSTSFFLQAAVNMIGISFAGIQLITMSESGNIFQNITVFYTGVFHIFFECAYGQRLIDHSSRVHEYLIDVKWYQTSLRTRKILNLMVLRARYPCVLTAASMLNMSMETFSAVLRTSMSYFTVLRSAQ